MTKARRTPKTPKRPDLAGMRRAVKDFLTASGVDLTDPNLTETPERVAEAWANDFLDGYQLTPEEALGETYPASESSKRELVVVTHLRFHSMCPHHLLPFAGTAHVAYLPKDRVVGFGRLGALVNCFAHRLILQEELARQVARALSTVLGADGAACILEAEHACMRVRGGEQSQARSHADAYEGLLADDKDLRRELWARIHPTEAR